MTKTMMEKIVARATAVLEESLREQDIEKYVRRLVSANIDKVVMVALGFRQDSWSDRWELDHNRDMTPVRDMIQTKARAHVEACWDTFFGKVKDFVPKATVAALVREYRTVLNEAFEDAMMEKVRAAAREQALALAETEFAKVLTAAAKDENSDPL